MLPEQYAAHRKREENMERLRRERGRRPLPRKRALERLAEAREILRRAQ